DSEVTVFRCRRIGARAATTDRRGTFLPLCAATRAGGVQSSHNRPTCAAWLELYPKSGDYREAVAAALGYADGKDSLGVGGGSHRGDRPPEAGADRSPRRDRPEAMAAHDPGQLAGKKNRIAIA